MNSALTHGEAGKQQDAPDEFHVLLLWLRLWRFFQNDALIDASAGGAGRFDAADRLVRRAAPHVLVIGHDRGEPDKVLRDEPGASVVGDDREMIAQIPPGHFLTNPHRFPAPGVAGEPEAAVWRQTVEEGGIFAAVLRMGLGTPFPAGEEALHPEVEHRPQIAEDPHAEPAGDDDRDADRDDDARQNAASMKEASVQAIFLRSDGTSPRFPQSRRP